MASHAPLELFQKGFLPKSKTFLFLFYTINVAHVYTIYHIHTMLYIHIQHRVFFYRIILLHFYTTWLFLKTRHCIAVHMIICCLHVFGVHYFNILLLLLLYVDLSLKFKTSFFSPTLTKNLRSNRVQYKMCNSQ